MITKPRDFWRAASITRWQIPTRALALTVAVLAALLVAALVVESRSAAIRDLPSAGTPAPAEPVGNGQFRFLPSSGHIGIGVRYRFSLYTHCGLDNPVAVDFDDSFWDESGTNPASDGNGNPPAGFGNPFDRGVMTLVSPLRARFQSQSGAVVYFNRHPGPRVSYLCF